MSDDDKVCRCNIKSQYCKCDICGAPYHNTRCHLYSPMFKLQVDLLPTRTKNAKADLVRDDLYVHTGCMRLKFPFATNLQD